MMFGRNARSCADRIINICRPHLRPIIRGKARAKVESGARFGARIVNGYTYVDHPNWDAYNGSAGLATQLELYRKRFGVLPKEIRGGRTGNTSRVIMLTVTTVRRADLPG